MLDTVEMMVTYLTMSCLMRTTAKQPTLIEHGNKDEMLARDYLLLNPVLVCPKSVFYSSWSSCPLLPSPPPTPARRWIVLGKQYLIQ